MRQVGAMLLPPLTALALLLGVFPAQVQESQGSQPTPEVAHGPPKPPDAPGGIALTTPPAPVPSPTPSQRMPESPVSSMIRVTAVPAPVVRAAPSVPARTVDRAASDAVRTITSTAYCQRDRLMANGQPVHEADGKHPYGAVAMGTIANPWPPFGTRIRILTGTFAGQILTVEDRIGWGTEFDVFRWSCAEAMNYGRPRIQIASEP